MRHISEDKFRLVNWLPTSKGFDQCINTITYNFVNNACLYYLNEIFKFSSHCRIGTTNKFSKAKNPFRKTNTGQKAISYISLDIPLFVMVFIYYCVSVGVFIYLFFSRMPFSLIFFLTWGTALKIRRFFPVLCYSSHCCCCSYLSAVISQLQLLYFNF